MIDIELKGAIELAVSQQKQSSVLASAITALLNDAAAGQLQLSDVNEVSRRISVLYEMIDVDLSVLSDDDL